MRQLRARLFWVLLTATAISLAAQVGVNTGELACRIIDATGQPIIGASVTLTQEEGAEARTLASGPEGEARFPLLAPGTYHVRADAAGLIPNEVEDVRVFVGQSVQVVLALTVERPSFQVTASASVSPIDYEKTKQSNQVEESSIRNLPINQRSYLDLATLAPGVIDSLSIAESNDFRIPIAPTSGLSFAGTQGRGNDFTVDGITNTGATGNVRPSISQASVREFQINRNSYSAEFGGSYGGAINVVSKSGTSQIHGGMFGFLRHRDIQARNYFDTGKSAFTRGQYGAFLGGPIRKGSTYYFGSFERLDRHETAFVPILRDSGAISRLTASQEALLGFWDRSGSAQLAGLSQQLRGFLTPSANPAVRQLFESNSGVFPFSADNSQAMVRLDHRISRRHAGFLRANLTRQRDQNSSFGALVGRNHGSTARWSDQTLALSNTFVANARWSGITRAAFGLSRRNIIPTDSLGPELLIGGFGTFGRDYLYPYQQREQYLQVSQSFVRTGIHHKVSLGADLSPIRNSGHVDTFFGGRFIFGEFIPLSVLLDTFAGNPDFSSGLATGFAAAARPDLAAALYAPLNSLQAFSAGIPVAYIQGFGNSRLQSWRQHHSAFVEDTYRVKPGLTLSVGLRYQYDSPPDLRTAHSLNPRLGFAWSPWRKDSTVIRGGYGVFTSWVDLAVASSATQLVRPDLTTLFIPLSGVPGLINPATRQPVNSADIYQSLLGRGILGTRTIQFSDLAPVGIATGFNLPVKGGVQRDYTSPYAQQASLAVERAFGHTVVGISYNFSRVAHVWRTVDHNVVRAGTQPDGRPLLGLADPRIFNNYILESAGNVYYHALIVEANRRFRSGWSLMANFTWSKAIDDVFDWNIDYAPHNQLDPSGEKALSSFHRKYRLVAAVVYETRASSGGFGRLLSDWRISSITRANSFQPFNLLTGFDNVGDGQVNTHRPLGLGRNVGIGPALFTFDMRLARRFRIPGLERAGLEFTAEVFNALNHTNFRTLNSVVGPLPINQLPRPLKGNRGNPTSPLGFTSAHDPRQFQLGINLEF